MARQYPVIFGWLSNDRMCPAADLRRTSILCLLRVGSRPYDRLTVRHLCADGSRSNRSASRKDSRPREIKQIARNWHALEAVSDSGDQAFRRKIVSSEVVWRDHAQSAE